MKKTILFLIIAIVILLALFSGQSKNSNPEATRVRMSDTPRPTYTSSFTPTKTNLPTKTKTATYTPTPISLACANIQDLYVRSTPSYDAKVISYMNLNDCMPILIRSEDNKFVYTERGWLDVDYISFSSALSWNPSPTPVRSPTPKLVITSRAVNPIHPAFTPTPGSVSGNCDPSYPDVCIPPKPPDLDCKDIPFRHFRVLPPDPHNFDGNHDGWGCES